MDFHAEATSEKQALGWHLDGRAAAVVGTHTHVPTADARLLPQGTAFVTDLGMCGARDSIIGTKARRSCASSAPACPAVCRGEARTGRLLLGLIEIDDASGRAVRIERLDRELPAAGA